MIKKYESSSFDLEEEKIINNGNNEIIDSDDTFKDNKSYKENKKKKIMNALWISK